MTIFVDMDEVMADAYQKHIDLYNADFGANLTKDQCWGKEFWRCVPEAHQDSVHGHASRVGFFIDLKIMPDCQEVLEELNRKHEVYIASAAMQFPNSLKEKSDWLDANFPFITWQQRILCGHKHVLKGDVLIDDRAYNLERFEGRSIIFTAPHNVDAGPFERAGSWRELGDLLL